MIKSHHNTYSYLGAARFESLVIPDSSLALLFQFPFEFPFGAKNFLTPRR
jgi:hypothetical protein